MQLGNLELPDSGRRELMKATMKLLGSLVSIPKERMAAVLADIDTLDMVDLLGSIVAKFPAEPAADPLNS